MTDKTLIISECSADELPRGKMIHNGPESLLDYELIALLLRTGKKNENVLELSRRILRENNGLKGLRNTDLEQLQQIDGIKAQKATTIMAAIELGRRFSKLIMNGEKRKRISNPADVYDYLHYEMGHWIMKSSGSSVWTQNR